MFRASSAHLQEDRVVHQQPSPPVSSHSSCVPTGHQELSYRVTVPYAARVQLYPPEDEHLRLETCRGEYYFMNKL